MAEIAGGVLTIASVGHDCYRVEENGFRWADEMLEPVEKTLDNLVAGDFVENGDGNARKILAAIDGCYLVSYECDHKTAGSWYTADELKRHGYCIVKPDAPAPTIEIDGKKYKKADVEKATKDLEVVEEDE